MRAYENKIIILHTCSVYEKRFDALHNELRCVYCVRMQCECFYTGTYIKPI